MREVKAMARLCDALSDSPELLLVTDVISTKISCTAATHIKLRLLIRAVILFSEIQIGNFSLRKEFAPRGSNFFPLREVPNDMENHY